MLPRILTDADIKKLSRTLRTMRLLQGVHSQTMAKAHDLTIDAYLALETCKETMPTPEQLNCFLEYLGLSLERAWEFHQETEKITDEALERMAKNLCLTPLPPRPAT